MAFAKEKLPGKIYEPAVGELQLPLGGVSISLENLVHIRIKVILDRAPWLHFMPLLLLDKSVVVHPTVVADHSEELAPVVVLKQNTVGRNFESRNFQDCYPYKKRILCKCYQISFGHKML